MRPVTSGSGATWFAAVVGLWGCCPLQEGGDSTSSNHGPEGSVNLHVLMRCVKHSNHIVALLPRCADTTRAALMHTDVHRNGPLLLITGSGPSVCIRRSRNLESVWAEVWASQRLKPSNPETLNSFSLVQLIGIWSNPIDSFSFGDGLLIWSSARAARLSSSVGSSGVRAKSRAAQ